MRIIGGEFRSRKLKSLPGSATRPTPDRLRQALFDVLAPVIEGSVFIDAYAGTGAVGIEALSRGAVRAVFLEHSPRAAALIHENLRSLGLESRAVLRRTPAASALRSLPEAAIPGAIVFLDPPYTHPLEYDAALDALAGWSQPRVIAQHDSHALLPDTRGPLRRLRVLTHGSNSLSFYEPA